MPECKGLVGKSRGAFMRRHQGSMKIQGKTVAGVFWAAEYAPAHRTSDDNRRTKRASKRAAEALRGIVI